MNKFAMIIMAACLILLMAVPALAGWSPAGLEGENVTALTEDIGAGPPVWYAGTAMGNIYSYDDVISAWTLISTGLPGQSVLSIEIAPMAPSKVFAGTYEDGVYKLDSGGQSWSSSGLYNAPVSTVKVDPYSLFNGTGNDIVVAVTDIAVYKSIDGGGQWLPVLYDTDLRDFTFDTPDYSPGYPSSTDTMYAASATTIYKSTDGGSNWVALDTFSSGVTDAIFSKIKVDPLEPSILYAGTENHGIMKSSDSGSTWSVINNGMGDQNITSITFYVFNTTSLLAGTADGKIYRTDDGGNNWYLWHTLDSGGTTVNSIGFISPEATYIFAATDNGVIMFDNSLPDLVVTSITGADSLATGIASPITVTVKNQGAGFSGSTYIAARISADTAYHTIYDPRVGLLALAAMAPGEEITLTFNVTIPLNKWNGINYLLVKADENVHNNSIYTVKESDETNNVLVVQTNVLGPDFVVTSITGADSLATGIASPITVTVKNQGAGFSGSTHIVARISANTAYHTIYDPRVGWLALAGMTPGEEITLTMNVTIPDGWPEAGYLLVKADENVYNNSIYTVKESDETNNVLAAPLFNIAPVADADADQTLECAAYTGAQVILNGSGSSDLDNDTLTYTWTGPFGVANDVSPSVDVPLGTHVITLTVDDGKGGSSTDSVDVTVVDTTPPATSALISGTLGNGGWFISPATMTLSSTDSCSGVASLNYNVDGTSYSVAGSSASISLVDGEHAISYNAVDNTGNIEAQKQTSANVDSTGPSITVAGISDGAEYSIGMVPPASYSVTDATSGVDTSSDSLTGGDDVGLGTFTYAVSAIDNAGNAAEASASYMVIATLEGLEVIIHQRVIDGKIQQQMEIPLLSKVDADAIEAFINQINAQRGLNIDDATADELIAIAQALMANF